MLSFTDQVGHTISLAAKPHKIVSLVPSQTELLYDLGLDDEVVGITKFCVHPNHWFHNKTRVGGPKQVHIDIIDRLQPDLIIANKEENVKEQIEDLSARYPVWTSDVPDLGTALQMIEAIGDMTAKGRNALLLMEKIKAGFSRLPAFARRPRAAYLVWQRPFMTVGGDTFIHAMMTAAGFENAFAERRRYPEVTLPEITAAGCEYVLLSSEPFPFTEKHAAELAHELAGARVMIVNGEMFSWYGSRLAEAAAYFEKMRSMMP